MPKPERASGRVRFAFWIRAETSNAPLRLTRRIERCDETVAPDEHEKLPPDEKEHFATCSECGEIFDRRSLDEVLFHHTDHKDRPDIQYSGSEKLDYGTTAT